jgi:hypothetical protein
MPNRPQHPPEGSHSLHMASSVCRPTSPPPRKKDPLAEYQAMQRHCEDLEEDVRRLTIAVGKYECAKCGAERSEHRGIHAVSSDPVCNECGEYWL